MSITSPYLVIRFLIQDSSSNLDMRKEYRDPDTTWERGTSLPRRIDPARLEAVNAVQWWLSDQSERNLGKPSWGASSVDLAMDSLFSHRFSHLLLFGSLQFIPHLRSLFLQLPTFVTIKSQNCLIERCYLQFRSKFQPTTTIHRSLEMWRKRKRLKRQNRVKYWVDSCTTSRTMIPILLQLLNRSWMTKPILEHRRVQRRSDRRLIYWTYEKTSWFSTAMSWILWFQSATNWKDLWLRLFTVTRITPVDVCFISFVTHWS